MFAKLHKKNELRGNDGKKVDGPVRNVLCGGPASFAKKSIPEAAGAERAVWRVCQFNKRIIPEAAGSECVVRYLEMELSFLG